MAWASASDLEGAVARAEREPAGSAARILRCAEGLFAERGFDGVTTREVASAAGVNVATLHFHWSDKRTLYEAVCRLQARQILRFVEEADRATAGEPRPPAERIARWVERTLDLLIENPAIARLAWQSVSGQSPPDLPTLLQHDLDVVRSLQSRIRAALGGGRPDADLVVIALFYVGIGVASDSPLQRAVLGSSVSRSPELRRRLSGFARRLVLRLLDPPRGAEP